MRNEAKKARAAEGGIVLLSGALWVIIGQSGLAD